MEHLDERVPRHLRRRAHRHRPRRVDRRRTSEREALATIGLVRVENPLEFGIVITHEDGSIERFLEKPTWGQVFSDTINTGIYVLEPEIFDYIAPTTGRSTSPATSSPRCSRPGEPLYGAVAEGYWEDVGTLEAYVRAHKDILDGKVEVDDPGLRARPTACGWARAPRSTPTRAIDRPGRHRRQLPRRGRVPPGRVHRARHQRAGAPRRRARAHASCTTTSTSARACACAAPWSAGPATCAAACAARRASVLGDECFVGEDAVARPGREGLPVQDRRGRRGRQHLDRLGVPGRPQPVRPRRRVAASPTSTSPPSSRSAWPWPTARRSRRTPRSSRRRDSSRSARMLKRAMMAGLNAGGVNVMDLEVASRAASPGSTCRSARPTAVASPCASPTTTPTAVDHPLLRRRRRRHHRGRASARSSGSSPARTSAGCCPAEIGDIELPAPGARALRRGPRGRPSTSKSVRGRRVQGRDRLRATARPRFVMPNVLAKLGAEVLAVNPYVSTAGVLAVRPRRARRAGRRPGARVRRRPRRGARPRR